VTVLSVRELNANISRALSRVEAGEVLEIARNGVVIAELRPKSSRRTEDPLWRASFEALMEDVSKGVPFGRTFGHDERNG
jgi:antitoxin (DNA-binding transcriptional repressor) of toxin-antitoxin stability system